jgi:hypothetical protein
MERDAVAAVVVVVSSGVLVTGGCKHEYHPHTQEVPNLPGGGAGITTFLCSLHGLGSNGSIPPQLVCGARSSELPDISIAAVFLFSQV